ncbi:hypothetical protein JCM8547_008936 [Rhodosporidiobolus lusitaniae]
MSYAPPSSADRPFASYPAQGGGERWEEERQRVVASENEPAEAEKEQGEAGRRVGSGFEVVNRGRRAARVEEQQEDEGEQEPHPPHDVLTIITAPSAHPPLPPHAIELVPPTPTTSTDSHFPFSPSSHHPHPSSSSLSQPPTRPTLRKKLSDSLLGLRNFGDSLRSSFRRAPSPSPSPLSFPASIAPEPSPPQSALTSLIHRLSTSPPPVKVTLINETGLEVRKAWWPVVLDRGEEMERVELRSERGEGWVGGGDGEEGWGEGVDGDEEEREKEVGRMKRPEKKGVLGGNEHAEGWLFLDLVLPPSSSSPTSPTSPLPENPGNPYLIHLQLYLRLSTSGSAKAAFGRLDLDSSEKRPCPSGVMGRVEVVRERRGVSGLALGAVAAAGGGGASGMVRSASDSSGLSLSPSLSRKKDTNLADGDVVEVRFVLTPEVAEVRNTVDDSTREGGRFWLPSKGVVVSSWVSVEGVSLSVLLGNEARYHEHYPSSSPHHDQLDPPPFPSSSSSTFSSSNPRPSLSTLSHRRSGSASLFAPSRLRKLSSSSSSTLSSLALTQRDPASAHPLRTSKHVLEGLDWASCFFHVRKEREVLLERTVKVNPLHGSAIGKGVVSTLDTPAVFHPQHDLTISYGFFDSGIARAKQMYIYCAKLSQTWLGDMIDEDERVLEVPFEKLVLAGSHDAGMLGSVPTELLDFLARGNGEDIPLVARALPFVRFLLSLLKTMGVGAHRMLANLSMTQKDSVRDQLRMGVRFFDLRPGYNLYDVVDEVKGPLRHQHAIVPGVDYIMALVDILAFLSENDREVVVVELKDDGIPFKTDLYPEPPATSSSSSPTSSSAPLPPPAQKPIAISMVPSSSDLAAALSAAKSSSPLAAREIQVGGAQDLGRTIGELLSENRRLVIVDRVHEEERAEGERWERADSYTHDLYDTDDPLKVLSALDATHSDAAARSARRVGPRSTIYQLQATPTAQIWADIGPSLTYSDASSLLVWSKARMDRVTYPWLAKRAFVEEGLVVFLTLDVWLLTPPYCLDLHDGHALWRNSVIPFVANLYGVMLFLIRRPYLNQDTQLFAFALCIDPHFALLNLLKACGAHALVMALANMLLYAWFAAGIAVGVHVLDRQRKLGWRRSLRRMRKRGR